MKNEKYIKFVMKELNLASLIKELFQMDEMHQEYTDNDMSFCIDSEKKDDSTLVFTIKLKENKDKKEFEKWVNDLDDDLFNETWEALSEKYGLKDLNEAYNTDNYKAVINEFKSTAKQIAQNRIKRLTSLFNF